ncbi:MAG: glycosyltransferase family 4 protein [Candidatus Paceibacterota bacterium]
MKVLMISSGTNTKFFERESSVRKRMAEYGSIVDELHIIVFSPKGYEVEQIADNVWVYPTNSVSKLFYSFDGIRIGKTIVDGDEWIITAQDPFEAGFAAWSLSYFFEIPFEVQVHGDIYNTYFITGNTFNVFRRPVGFFVLPKADHIRVVSQRIADSLQNRGIPKEKITVFPVVVDIDVFKKSEPSFDVYDKYPQFDSVLLAVSRLEVEKDIPTALRALAYIVQKGINAGLVIVGTGRLKKDFRDLVKNLGIEKRVIFEGWQDDLVSYYKTADIFLNTSLHEGYARTLIEAAASGIPIISTDVGIVGDILIGDRDIEVCDTGDEICFATKTSELLKNEKKYSQLRKHARNSVEAHIYSQKGYLSMIQKNWKKCLMTKS